MKESKLNLQIRRIGLEITLRFEGHLMPGKGTKASEDIQIF